VHDTTMSSGETYFLGLDSSTQGLKATVIDRDLGIVYERAVNYDRDLPSYGTEGGAHRGDDGLTVTAPPLMWADALDLLFGWMREDGFAFEHVAAVSGSGQQHGSVWLSAKSLGILQGLRSDAGLADQLRDVFTVPESPIWMDASTTRQCRRLEESLGGAQAVAELTGSRAYERFTGNQIAKVREENVNAYQATDRILLVSSYMASLLIGDYAPIDFSDGSGMNLMNIVSRCWAEAAVVSTAPGLAPKLGEPVPSSTVIGLVHRYFVNRYGFSPQCRVIAFSGDNPNSLAGLRLERAGDVAISMGTSNTMFGVLADPHPSATEGHIFVNPVDNATYMAMIVYQNGTLAWERVRDLHFDGSWKPFDDALDRTAPGNGGHIGFYFYQPEITPPVLRPGVFRFDSKGAPVNVFSPAEEARAIVESSFLSMRLHSSHVGLTAAKIVATGGASIDKSVLRVMADVFGVPVYVAEKSDSASLGAAYRAFHGWRCAEVDRMVPFSDIAAKAPPFRLAVEPDASAHDVYTYMLLRYAALEARCTSAALT
jgi:xylulokinase